MPCASVVHALLLRSVPLYGCTTVCSAIYQRVVIQAISGLWLLQIKLLWTWVFVWAYVSIFSPRHQSHFTVEETNGQSGRMTCPRSHGWGTLPLAPETQVGQLCSTGAWVFLNNNLRLLGGGCSWNPRAQECHCQEGQSGWVVVMFFTFSCHLFFPVDSTIGDYIY